MRIDEAWVVVITLVVVCLLAFAATELLAQALQPVSDALMAGVKDSTVEVVP